MCGTRIYHIWRSVLDRCNYQSKERYAHVTLEDDRWLKFDNFYEDMKDGYQDDLSIDRKDGSRGYCKENCRWATSHEQTRNRKSNVFVVYRGQRMVFQDAMRYAVVSRASVRQRLAKGWSIEDALETPRTRRILDVNGERVFTSPRSQSESYSDHQEAVSQSE